MSYHDKTFEGVIGRTLTGIAVSQDGETTLRLTFADGEHYITTDGDCCSESWWADVIGAASNYGGIVQEVRAIDLPYPADDRTRQKEDCAYGYDIVTTKGVVNLVFRNSSNGYYGGEAFDTETPPQTAWTPIAENDWRA